LKAIHTILLVTGDSMQASELKQHYNEQRAKGYNDYDTYLYDESEKSPLRIQGTAPEFAEDAPIMNGYEILNRYFDELLSSNNKVVAFGEDVGKIGDVNQGLAGLQINMVITVYLILESGN
jgi:hypothetical protein